MLHADDDERGRQRENGAWERRKKREVWTWVAFVVLYLLYITTHKHIVANLYIRWHCNRQRCAKELVERCAKFFRRVIF